KLPAGLGAGKRQGLVLLKIIAEIAASIDDSLFCRGRLVFLGIYWLDVAALAFRVSCSETFRSAPDNTDRKNATLRHIDCSIAALVGGGQDDGGATGITRWRHPCSEARNGGAVAGADAKRIGNVAAVRAETIGKGGYEKEGDHRSNAKRVVFG